MATDVVEVKDNSGGGADMATEAGACGWRQAHQ